LSSAPAARLRGAQLANDTFNNPNIRFWKQLEEFPKWGGNAFRINISSAEDGVAILPGHALTERLAMALNRYTTVIDWALQHNIHFIISFSQRNTAGGGPLTWPDDGRSMWKDASAQDELVQAWADLAIHFRGRKGVIFDLVNEPHGETADEIAGNHALPKKVWNTLYPRLIDAIRSEDPERGIILEPIWGSAGNLVDLSISKAPNLIYSFHFYDPHFFTLQGLGDGWPPAQSVVYPGVTRDAEFEPEMFWDKSVLEQALLPAVNFRNANNVRVMCGEFGTQTFAPMDSRERWVTDVVDLLELYGFDWVYWSYNRLPSSPGAWTFQRTAYESVITSKFGLNLEYGDFDAAGNFLLAGRVEGTGLSRSAAFHLFNTSGVLQTTQFALTPDFRSELSFVLGNFDADGAHEVLVGGRETSGLARGPAYQLFETNGTPKFTRFVLTPDFSYARFSPLNVGSNGVLVCGQEIDGLARGPAYEAFDASGNLVHTQFSLGADFVLRGCLASNLDGVGDDEVIVWGREIVGLERGLAIQGFGPAGSPLFTRFVSNTQLAETGLTVVDVDGARNIVFYGREISAANRGPAYHTFNSAGNPILNRFVLNPDFRAFQLFGANTTNSVNGQEIVTGGVETNGLARGPAIQVWDKNGNQLFMRFVLNADFTEVTFGKIDINNDGLDEILVVGRETKGLARGPAFQLFDGDGNLLVGPRFVFSSDFTNLKVFTVDQNGDGDEEIGIGGIESSGLKRGPAYQIFDPNGNLLQTQFVLSPGAVACGLVSLQSAIETAHPGSTLTVIGTCNENILIRNEKQRITIDGGATASINAPNSFSPALNVRGKGILIQGFTIIGGSVGVYVNRGSNAVINNNVIQNSNGNGVVVDEVAFAVLTNNTIQNNPGAGVFVSENSTARIGFNSDAEAGASANTITNNGVGVVVSNNSSGRIIGNTIQNNTGVGVQVLRDSHTDIASNTINNNADGIEVGENSLVQLGEDSGSSIYESPNTTSSANIGFGIRCTAGGTIDGRLGSLMGLGGLNSFDGSCVNSLIP
jgi:hypothetical protein